MMGLCQGTFGVEFDNVGDHGAAGVEDVVIQLDDAVDEREVNYCSENNLLALLETSLCQGTYGVEFDNVGDDGTAGVEDVVIQLDDAIDEVELPVVGKNYAPAEPPMQQDVRPAVQWFDNDDDDDYRPEEDVFGSTSSLKELEKRLGGGDKLTLSELTKIDAHAKQAGRRDGDSFYSLLTYLRQPIPGGSKIRELLTVRAIAVWLANQEIETGKGFGTATTDTPNGYLQMQKEKRATYASFFTALCREAGLQCTLLHGVCKAGSYQPGDTELERCSWVAVRVQGNWQFVHPYWVCRAMIGRTVEGWTKLESDGKTVSQRQVSSQGKIQSAFKETYFFPRPEDFIYVCYPDVRDWQLLAANKRLKNEQAFVRQAFLLPAFFGLGLTLLSTNCCELETKSGTIDIIIKGKKIHSHKLMMTYDLFIKDAVLDDSDMLNPDNLPRLVLNSRSEEKFSFQIRFPVEGTYKIVFYAGFYRRPMVRVCEFKLTCHKRLPGCQLLPINTGFDGWGPGPKSEAAGLYMASQQGGVIHVQTSSSAIKGEVEEEDKTAQVKFALDQNKMKATEYSAEMIGGESSAHQDLTDHVTCEVNEQTHELDVRARVSEPGEYALVIKAGKKGAPTRKRSVCNYLITTLAGIREGVPQRKARTALKRALSRDSNLEEIADLMGKCQKAKLDDNDDDVKAAKQRHTFLLVKQHLNDCIKRRNLDVTKRSLSEVSKYRHKLALQIETRRVEKLKEQLEKLGGFTREVPQLNKACEELVYLSKAKPEVHCTMKTLFMLLDDAPDPRLDDWGHIQSLLKLSKEHNSNVLGRMQRISEQEMDARRRRKIHAHLHQHTEAQVRHSSQAAASFYIWIDGVLKAFGETAGEKQEG